MQYLAGEMYFLCIRFDLVLTCSSKVFIDVKYFDEFIFSLGSRLSLFT
jgi:hypothetical protein